MFSGSGEFGVWLYPLWVLNGANYKAYWGYSFLTLSSPEEQVQFCIGHGNVVITSYTGVVII